MGSISSASAVSISNGGSLTLTEISGNTFANSVTNGVGGVGTLIANTVTTFSSTLTDGAAGQLALICNGRRNLRERRQYL